MVCLELTAHESVVLGEILESYLSDLKTERAHTDNRELRAELKEKELFLDAVLKRLNI